MRKIAIALLLAAGCAHAPAPAPQPCVAKAPAKVMMEYMAEPGQLAMPLPDGGKVDALLFMVTAQSLVDFAKYVDELEKIAARAATGCVAK